MAEKLSVQIALDGAAEIERQLESLGEAGKKAFGDIGKAAEQVGGFSNLDPKDVEAKLKSFGITGEQAINKIQSSVKAAGNLEQVVTAVQGVEQGFRSVDKTVTQSVTSFANLGQTIEGAHTELRAIGTALRELGAGPFAEIFRLFEGVGTRLGGLALAATAVAGFSAEMFKFAQNASEVQQSLTRLQGATGASLTNLSAMQTAFAAGGTSAQKFGEEFTNLALLVHEKSKTIADDIQASADAVKAAALSVDSAQLALSKAQAVAGAGGQPLSEEAQQEFRAREASLAVAQAEVALDAAERSARQARANDLGELIQKYQKLSEGIQQTFDPLTTMEAKSKAVIAALAQMGTSVDGISGNFGSMSDKGQEAFIKLADIFKNLGNEADQMELGKKLGLSPETIETLGRGGDALRELRDQIKALGISLDATDEKSLTGFRESLNSLSSTWTALMNKMGALAAPAFTSLFEGIGEGLRTLIPQLLALAQNFGQLDLKEFGRGIIEKLGDIVTGVNTIIEVWKSMRGEIDKSLLPEWLQPFIESLRTTKDEINAIITALQTISGASTVLAGQIRKGLQEKGILSGDPAETQKQIDDFIKKFQESAGTAKTGGKEIIAMYGDVADAATQMKDTTVPAWDDITSAIGNSGTAIDDLASKQSGLDWNAISNAGTTAWNTIADSVQGGIDAVANFVSSLTNITWDDIVNTAVNGWNSIIDVIGNAINAVLRFLGLQSQASAATATGGDGGDGGDGLPFASGGIVGGRGTGTSDSNLAWLSRGEHVMPALAVSQPGVLAFLEALRRSGGNLSAVLDGMGRFALGGMVAQRSIPAFAGGGFNRGGSGASSRTLNLTIDGRSFTGLSVPEHTAQSLERFAVHSQIASTGRKPSWRR